MIEKNGELTDKSKGDLNTTKKAEYIEKNGFEIVGEGEQHLLKEPVKIVFKPEDNK